MNDRVDYNLRIKMSKDDPARGQKANNHNMKNNESLGR